MANDTTYNGWTNRETWLVNLWYGDYFAELTDEGDTIDAEYIEAFIAEQVDQELTGTCGFVRDMIDLRAIDYAELAEHYAPSAYAPDEPATDDEEG